ncbi:hypothetical protein NXV32_17315 [Bacteroides fragilis]|nr:hypothetical protein NXV32_17315 [Bacteroides fragilis]
MPEEMITLRTPEFSVKVACMSKNPFFSVINELLRIVGINEYSCFMVYAFTFALCAMIFMKDYRTYARYMFPLFLIGFMNFEESMIRQAFSYSFSSYI